MSATETTLVSLNSPGHSAEDKVATVPKHVPLLGSHLKLAFYIRVIPFQPKFDVAQKRWTVTSSKFHLVSCLLLTWLPCILRATFSAVMETALFLRSSVRSAKSYFEMAFFYLHLLGSVYIFRIVASRKGEIAAGINSFSKILGIHHDSEYSVWRLEGRARKIISSYVTRAQVYFVLVGTVYYALMLGMIAIAIIYPAHTQFFIGKNLFARQFLLFSDPDNSTGEADDEIAGSSEVIRNIMSSWLFDTLQVVGFIPEFFLMVPYPLSLWLAVKKFEIFLLHKSGGTENGKLQTVEEETTDLAKRYEQLKEFSNTLNASWGKLNFIWHLATLNITIFGLTYLNEGSWSLSRSVALTIVLMRIVCYTMAVKFSADVFVKMENIRQWLTSPEAWSKFWLSDSRPHIERIYMDLGSSPVGISYDGMYQCTYGFIAQVLAFIITIFVVTFD